MDLFCYRTKPIKEGFAHLKDGRAYNDLYHAARSRAEADWLVGINATRALTCKYNAQLSCGRVQTPTLAMIAHREQQTGRLNRKIIMGCGAQLLLSLVLPALQLLSSHGHGSKRKAAPSAPLTKI